MRTDRIFFTSVNLALLLKIEKGKKVPVKYKVVHHFAIVYQHNNYYQNIDTKVKYKKKENCNVNDLYVDSCDLFSFSDVIKEFDELNKEQISIPKYISRRKVLKLVKERVII